VGVLAASERRVEGAGELEAGETLVVGVVGVGKAASVEGSEELVELVVEMGLARSRLKW